MSRRLRHPLVKQEDADSKSDGEPIKLPENLESLPRAEHFAAQRHRWNTNEEIAAILISFDKHSDWQSKEVKIRPKSGSMLLYSRKKVRYRRDGYCWKKRKDGKTTREDHMKLKVQGTECIYGCYVHSAILPTFHRRCYWLLQNPDIVLVHYLNVPYPDDNKLATVAPSLALWADKKEWTKDELVCQLKPMLSSVSVFSEDDPDHNNDLEISGKMFQTSETVEVIVTQLMEKQRAARAAALARQLECGCPDSTCNDSRNCAHPMRRVQAAKPPPSDHQVSSTTGPSPRPMSHPPRQYTRDHRPAQQSASPLLLSLGQIQGGGGLLILNGTSNGTQQNSSLVSPLSVTSFVCEEPRDRYRQQYKPTFVLKREIPDSQPTVVQTTETKFEIEPKEEKIDVDVFERKIKVEPRSSVSRNQVIASAPATPSRYPDLVERLESKVLTDNCDDTLVLLGTDSNLGSSGFFDETLELSHEDIQKTLSANMPTCELDRNGVRHTDTANVMVSGIDTMDFIDSCEVVASPATGVDDNVFVNLDAFDMLGDFPELEVLDPSGMSSNPVSFFLNFQTLSEKSPAAEDSSEKMQTESSSEGTLNITDYSPEWAYPEGGAKVLVAGPWTDTSDQYTVLFDNFPVPSILVQNGLLRCYCPAHEAGLAALQVARGGRVVSDTVVFEYKPGPAPAPSSPASAPLPSLDLRRFSLLQRLQRLQGRLQMKIEPADENSQIEDVQLYSNPKFEERLVSFCRSLSSRSTGTSEGFTTEPNEDGSTILHLAAALGYTKLTTVLLRWRQDDTSLALEKEVNLGARDSDNCTPLMVASAAGHVETAVVLARWSAGTRREAGARAAAAAARRAGHSHLAALLDRIHPPAKDGVFLRPHSLSQKSRAGSLESNLVKRPSIDSGINMADAFRSSSAIDKSESSSSARWERSMSLPLDSDTSEDSLGDSKIGRRMDLALCETAPRRAASPLIDVEALSDHDAASPPAARPRPAGEQDDRVFTLAEQIIAAMPERIKNESSSLLSGCGLDSGGGSGEDTLMVPLLDENTTFNSDFTFEFCDNTYSNISSDFSFNYYRYCGGSTPCSSGSVSPGSAALSPPPPSPRSALSHPPLCTTPSATLQEFLNATTHFSNLTLNDREQRELYSAAITIQKAYRQYRGRQLQRRAAAAAITIQNCYRRYKQFAYLKQMHAAATVIQRGYRAMRARRMATTPINRRTYSQRRQNQAARKIQQFMRQSKINTWEEFTTNVAERTSRKREGGPAIAGCPPKLAAAHHQYTTHAQ
ncbi:calmodulin-binding transcription activator 2 isoform X8 [Spodoptera frugiperda]|uniref:Calmodulin-binding transcription activator 2 isoform X8 n=1 Tax=Spodoptera frugiperda TaxID=7108 RepID=A0A9R0D563_SPOFR|nr:calmodulin-binding transcription activator 2 isoform X8 [Spodoptera frugiperda]